MDLAELLDGIDAAYDGHNAVVGTITDRIEDVGEGTLFVCVPGKNTDGHVFAKQALAKGAVGVICSTDLGLPRQIITKDTRKTMALLARIFYHNPSEKLRLVGITGTNGKTTTAHWIRDLLCAENKKTALIGTLGVQLQNEYLQTGYTTPDALTMNRILQEFVNAGCRYAVAEISSQALDQQRCEGLCFEQAVFTNLSREHLDYHGNMDRYAAAKAKLFSVAKTAVINADDSYAAIMKKACRGNVLTCSVFANADMVARNISYKDGAVSYILVYRTDIARVQVLTPGLVSVYNSMTAIASCVSQGMDFYAACEHCKKMMPVRGRMQRILQQAPFAVYVDYAHTPSALLHALQTVRTCTDGKIWLVFGCGGERDRSKRPVMGHIADENADFTVLTDDNPRNEKAEDILMQIAEGFSQTDHYVFESDRHEAIRYVLQRAQSGDSILIAGKGHEQLQIRAGVAQPFDDVSETQKIWDALQK